MLSGLKNFFELAATSSRRRSRFNPGFVSKIGSAVLVCGLIVLGLPMSAGTGDEQAQAGALGKKTDAAVFKMPIFDLKTELCAVSNQIRKTAEKPHLHAGVFAIEPSTGRFISVDGSMPFAAASLIKVPVLVKLLDAIDRGEVKADESLELRPDLIGGGSGYLQWRPAGCKVSLKEAMEAMIIVSDNTATNMIIDRVGGRDICNRQFTDWGLKHTYINEWLPDLSGTNKTSPFDLAAIIAKVDRGELLSKKSRERMLAIMERTRTRTLLPQGIPAGARISHKTGDIGSLVGDAGIITAPDGRRFLAVVQVERPHNDRRANELIRQLSRIIYQAMTNSSPQS